MKIRTEREAPRGAFLLAYMGNMGNLGNLSGRDDREKQLMKTIIKNVDNSLLKVYSILKNRLLVIIAACVVLVVRKLVKDKKEGKTCCGCSSCGGSCGCGHGGSDSAEHKA